MKKGKFLLFLLPLILLFLVGCSDDEKTNTNNSGTSDTYGTYYLYKDEELNKDKYFKISSSKWEDESGDSGTVSISGTAIKFYMEMFGSNDELYSGTISNGKLEISISGIKTTYYKEGKEPKSNNSGGSDNSNTNTTTTVTITYDANGGSFTSGLTITETKEKNSYLVAPVSPTKQGESFAGWTTEKNGNVFWDFSSNKITENTTLYAKWNQNDASIISFDGATFDGNNIELVVNKDTDYVSLSNKIVTSSNSVWKLYYDRLGQTEIPTKIAASSSGKLLNGNNIFYIVVTSGNQTNLYELNVYRSYAVSISYKNGQTNLNSEVAYTGYEYTFSYTPSIKGYTFNYWTLDNNKVEKLIIKDYVTLYANVTANKYNITLNVNDGNALSNTTYEATYDEYYQLPVPTRVGYTFNGWEYNGTLKTDSNGGSLDVYNYDNNITLRAKWTVNQYQVTTNVNNSNAGTVTGSGSYNYNSSVTITATTNDGYTFEGWYDGNNELTKELSYTFNMPASNITYTAEFIANKYTITIDNQAADVNFSGIISGNKYDFNTKIIMKAVSNSGLLIAWIVNENIESIGNEFIFYVPSEDINITITTSAYIRNENNIYFGTYPQTNVTDETLISELNTLVGKLPNSDDLGNWTDYNYYVHRITNHEVQICEDSYMYYQDIDYDNNGTYDYRGVYFTQYRQIYAPNGNDWIGFQNENGYFINTIYWFSFDPIEWIILNESSGKALIIANLVLDCQDYYPSDSKELFEHNNGIGYINNYELSNIRKWLNNNFYSGAFNDLQKALINETEVDNSAVSFYKSTSDYACNNTYDNLFLLSYREARIYSNIKYTNATDYAKCQGAPVTTYNGEKYCGWWLRSPYTYNDNGDHGDFGSTVITPGYDIFLYSPCVYDYRGVRPACWINL